MTPAEFIAKWSRTALTERSAAQQHFLDLCDLLGHPKPASVDPTGQEFTFEKGAQKAGGGGGWADVWKRGFFAWEYKGRHKDLRAAYRQLLEYLHSLENPPLLVVCDMDRIQVHTNFTNAPKQVYDVPLPELGDPDRLEVLRAVFFEPEKLHPGVRAERITQEAARRIAQVAERMRARGLEPHAVARFLDRIIFCLFAEDVRLLPTGLFTRLLQTSQGNPARFHQMVEQLFAAMADGGFFGADEIRHFNGHLFTGSPVLPLESEELAAVAEAGRLDWSALEPSIFGTLFERGLDPGKRSQLGAHYTSRQDIETLVEPVVMRPLRREWAETRETVESLLRTGKKSSTAPAVVKPLAPAALRKARAEADLILHRFLERLARVKVLDPACGSGNFLYVTLQKLKDLEKEVIDFALERGYSAYLPLVGPWQLYGIEVNPYACELAQMTVWIGYLQWVHAHGYGIQQDPILRPMEGNFRLMDAVLDRSDPANPREPEWPRVDFIVGNPPFLGGKKLRSELGDAYVDSLFALWRDRVPAEADLCCYWFEKARAQIAFGACGRAGLLATQGIRGGANRQVLARIKESGELFFAESDRPWVLDGANVHVSMAAFDDGREPERQLDGRPVTAVHADLTGTVDVTQARRLGTNLGIAFMGDTKGGAFDIPESAALRMLTAPNPHGRPNSDVVVPWINGLDVTRRNRGFWIIDFGIDRSEADAALYEAPFEHVARFVKPARQENNRESYRLLWWRHVEPRPGMWAAVMGHSRFLCTARVAKHRIFAWYEAPTLPDSQVFVFSRSDDYFFGVLHSRLHEVWALRLGTRLETRPRYTPTTCFETFPFPEPTDAQREAIAGAAAELDKLRTSWLNPPQWVREEVLEFPADARGPWARYVTEPDAGGIGTARYPRLVPKDADAAAELAKRTLTALYNQRPAWLDLAHRKLDAAVCAAYGWPADLDDEAILARLLELNRQRAAS